MPNPSDDGSPRGDGAGSPALYAAVRPGSGRVQPRALHDGAQQVGPGRPLRLASPWRPHRVAPPTPRAWTPRFTSPSSASARRALPASPGHTLLVIKRLKCRLLIVRFGPQEQVRRMLRPSEERTRGQRRSSRRCGRRDSVRAIALCF
jgi:hypothetical protein